MDRQLARAALDAGMNVQLSKETAATVVKMAYLVLETTTLDFLWSGQGRAAAVSMHDFRCAFFSRVELAKCEDCCLTQEVSSAFLE